MTLIRLCMWMMFCIPLVSCADEPLLYILFYRERDDSTLAMEQVFDRATTQMGKNVTALKINIDDPSEALIVSYHHLHRKAMPYVIVFSSDGVRQWHVSHPFTEQQLADATQKSAQSTPVYRGRCPCCCH